MELSNSGCRISAPVIATQMISSEYSDDPSNQMISSDNHPHDETGPELPGFSRFRRAVSRDNLDENGGGNQSLKRRPVAKV